MSDNHRSPKHTTARVSAHRSRSSQRWRQSPDGRIRLQRVSLPVPRPAAPFTTVSANDIDEAPPGEAPAARKRTRAARKATRHERSLVRKKKARAMMKDERAAGPAIHCPSATHGQAAHITCHTLGTFSPIRRKAKVSWTRNWLPAKKQRNCASLSTNS